MSRVGVSWAGVNRANTMGRRVNRVGMSWVGVTKPGFYREGSKRQCEQDRNEQRRCKKGKWEKGSCEQSM